MVGVLIKVWRMAQRIPWILSAIIFEFFQILIRSVHHNFPRIRAHFRVWVPINYYNLFVDGNHNLCFARPGQRCYLKYCSYSTIYWSMSIPVSVILVILYHWLLLYYFFNSSNCWLLQFWLLFSTSPGSSVGRASGF